jgi:hypothetical protein
LARACVCGVCGRVSASCEGEWYAASYR